MSEEQTINIDKVIYGCLYYLLKENQTNQVKPIILTDEVLFAVIQALDTKNLITEETFDLPSNLIKTNAQEQFQIKEGLTYNSKIITEEKGVMMLGDWLKENSDPIVITYLENPDCSVKKLIRK